MSLLRNLSLTPSREQESRRLDSRFRGNDILRHYIFRGRMSQEMRGTSNNRWGN